MRTLPLLALLAAAGCMDLSTVPAGWDPGADDAACAQNAPPFIGNFAMDSAESGERGAWVVGIHFDWADPGIAGAADPPNVEFGYVTVQAQGYVLWSSVVRPQDLVHGCMEYDDTDNGLGQPVGCPTAGFTQFGSAGCPAGSIDTCTAGQLNIAWSGEGASQFSPLDMIVRMRDRCGDVSNEFGLQYDVGDGYQTWQEAE